MKTILLLTDFSDNALNAMHYAINMFKAEKCLFKIMHVHKMGSFTADDILLGSSSENIYNIITNEAKDKLERLKDDFISYYDNSNHSFECLVDFDDFSDAVNQVIKSTHIDLIVLGSNGATGAKEILFGSNTLNIIRYVNCNTLIIPEKYQYKGLNHLLLPLSTKDTLHDKPKRDLFHLLPIDQLKLNVLRINPDHVHPEFDIFDKSNLEGFRYDYFTINNVPVQHAVNSFVQLNCTDIIIGFVKDKGFLGKLFSHPSVMKLNTLIKLPLLVLHNN